MKLRSIDVAQRLYAIECGKGLSCYGFDALDTKARAVCAWHQERPGVDAIGIGSFLTGWPELGTEAHFARCAAILDRAQIHCSVFGDRCPVELVPTLVGLEGRRVEAIYFGERIRFNVGRSTGWLPVHLRIHNKRSHGGEGLIPSALSEVRVIR